MNIFIWNEARKQAVEDGDQTFKCFNSDHLPLLTGLNYDLSLYLFCLECSFKKDIGLATYDRITKKYAKDLRSQGV